MKFNFGTIFFIVTLLVVSIVAEAENELTLEQLYSLPLEELSKVEVTIGSHIGRAAIAGALPVTMLNADGIETTGAFSGDELLRSIPQFGSIGFGHSRGGSTGINAARGDVTSVNLRSLGEGNTLVMLNGRRMVQHPITQTSNIDGVPVVSFNANTLPVAGLDRIEILRDSAGALYGSDAVAGVVNYVLKKDVLGSELSFTYGSETTASRDNITINGTKGIKFSDSATYLLLSGSYTRENGILASEKGYASNQDLRSQASEFATDTSLDHRSSLEVFPLVNYTGLGQFHLRPVDLIRDNGQLWGVSDCGGRGLVGSTTVIYDGIQELCLDVSEQDPAIRPNRNEVRTLSPDIERFNFFAYLDHKLESGQKLYSEASYYSSTTRRQWEQASILSNARFFVPADYYYNPFGPVTFADGRVNPNRLAGLDSAIVPEEGLGFELLSVRPVDAGTRKIEVASISYRTLFGLQGVWRNSWNYDTAVLYSKAEVEDVASNRISTPLFQAQLSLDTADAYNIFTGVNPANPGSMIDQTINPRSSIDPFITSASRKASTSLTLIDFKLFNPELFRLPAGDFALGMGVEWRKEQLMEDNSANFDGSQPFIDKLDPDLAIGEVTNLSSLQGSSVRPDLSASRTVMSAYAEIIVPLLKDLPGAVKFDMQFALRYEHFSDVGNITRPKLALSWYPVNWLQFRGAFSQGFRAPNLIQFNSQGTALTTSVDDYAEGILLGTGDINDGPANGNYNLETAGNQELKPEESDNVSFGILFAPISNLVVTADWWQIKTKNTVGVFTDENESRLDAVLRAEGGSNPRVIRATPDEHNPLGEILAISRRFENLNNRSVAGLDIGINYGFDTSVGSFNLKLNGARMLSFDQVAGGKALRLVEFGADESVLGASINSLIERGGIPKWRAIAAVNWNRNDNVWAASIFANYVGKEFEPAVTVKNKHFVVDDQVRVNFSVTHRGLLGDDSSIRFGINNLFDQDPPLASESFGFEGELHTSLARYIYVSLNMKFND